jgi:plasmid stability protein
VGRKIKAERHELAVEREFLAALQSARTTDDVRHVEAAAARVWWSQWIGFKLAFKRAFPRWG